MANPVQNPFFASPGANRGQAEHWTESYPALADSPEVVACFGVSADLDTPWEGFEGLWWDNQLAQFDFNLTDLVSAKFEYGTYQYEGFGMSWIMPQTQDLANPRWVHQSQDTFHAENFMAAAFDSGADAFEDFDESWDSVEDAVSDFTAATTATASFDSGSPEDSEDFEEEWQSVENAVADLSAGATTAAMFDAGANAYEGFEGVWTMTL